MSLREAARPNSALLLTNAMDCGGSVPTACAPCIFD